MLLVSALLTGVACHRAPSNVILVTFDTTRWDHVGYSSEQDGLTPTLDQLAADGAWFSTVVTSQPVTLPSHASILTGLYPTHHGVRNNGGGFLEDRFWTIPEALREAGYQTHAVVSAYVLDSRFGLAQGFDGYDDSVGNGRGGDDLGIQEISADRTADRAISWLRRAAQTDAPFFLWVHFFDPHSPYAPPQDVAALFPADPYAGEIHFADRELGRILSELASLGLRDTTLIAFTADHGEGLGDHGEDTHGLFVYESTTRVPLLFAGPGVPRVGRIDGLAETVDIMPTILDVVGLPVPDVRDGRSLAPRLHGHPDAQGRTAYLETFHPRLNFGWSELRAMRSGDDKAILAPRSEFYDLEADPGETTSLYGTGAEPEVARQLLAELRGIAQRDDAAATTGTRESLDLKARHALAKLGYVWPSTAPSSHGELADPKDRISFWVQAHEAQRAIEAGRADEAVALMTEAVAEDPSNVSARSILGTALEIDGQPRRALAVFLDLIELRPSWDLPHFRAARLLESMDRFAEAQELLEAVVKFQPQNPDSFYQLGKTKLDHGELEAAESLFRRTLEVDPTHEFALVGLAFCRERAGAPREGVAVLRDARMLLPESHFIVYNLASLYQRTGDTRRALDLYRVAVEMNPEDSASWNDLGVLLGRQGKKRDAVESVSRAHMLDPSNLSASFNLAALLIAADQPTAAVPLLEDVTTRRPEMVMGHVLLIRAIEASVGAAAAEPRLAKLAEEHPGVAVQVVRRELRERGESRGRRALEIVLDQGGATAWQAVQDDPLLKSLAPNPAQ